MTSSNGGLNPQAHGPGTPAMPIPTLTALSVALAFLAASTAPQPLMLAVFSELLLLCALGAATVAAITLQRPNAPQLVMWDKALFLAFGSLLAGAFVDAQAVAAYIEASAASLPPAPATPSSG